MPKINAVVPKVKVTKGPMKYAQNPHLSTNFVIGLLSMHSTSAVHSLLVVFKTKSYAIADITKAKKSMANPTERNALSSLLAGFVTRTKIKPISKNIPAKPNKNVFLASRRLILFLILMFVVSDTSSFHSVSLSMSSFSSASLILTFDFL